MEIPPDDPAEGEKAVSRYEALLALYPRDRAREMVKTYLAGQPVDDAVFLPDTSAEELEQEMTEVFADVDPEARDELEAMKQLFRDVRGKRPSELPPLTPEQEAEELDQETETAVAQMTSSWFNMLYAARTRANGGVVELSGDFLDCVPPILLGAFGDEEAEGTHWIEACCVSIALTPEQARELQALWAAALRPLIDAAPDGYVLWSDEFVIKKEGDGYRLLPRAP